jgi:hypothetical protein
MTEAELDLLERDVEEARNRIAVDFARLRSPAALSGFKDDVLTRGHEAKDEMIHKMTQQASSAAQRVVADLKDRAAANPAAALAIGAGLLWRFAHRPPIATLLVGVGLASLLRTSPYSAPSPVVTRTGEFAESAAELADSAAQKVRKWGEEARETAGETIAQVSATAADLASQASKLGERVSDAAERAFPESTQRDTFLLGAAALAVGAFTLIAYQRRED